MGINLGTSAIPKYQDFALKANLPLKKGGNLSLWSMGGNSNINILISEQTDSTQIDLPKHIRSGLSHAQDVLKGVDGIGFTYLTSKDVVRHPLVRKIVDAYSSAESDCK